MRTLYLVVFYLSPAFAQGFHAGLQAGVPLTEYFDVAPYAYSSATRRYTIGAFAEWQPGNSLAFQAGLLYHRIGYSGRAGSSIRSIPNFQYSAFNVSGSSWDFPLMAKYRFGRRGFRPYLAAGGVLRYIGPADGQGVVTTGSLVPTYHSTTTTFATSDPSDLRKRFYPGFTAAEGLEIPAGRLRVSPEIRYTRWLANISGPGGVLRFAPNQVELLVGFSF
jgi:hypothetical protein